MVNHPNRAAPLYPDVDTDVSGYVATIHYDLEGGHRLILPGVHDNFRGARDRARRVADAILASGETGLCGWVEFRGEKPAGFPRNGVKA